MTPQTRRWIFHDGIRQSEASGPRASSFTSDCGCKSGYLTAGAHLESSPRPRLEWVRRARKQHVPPLQKTRRLSSQESHKIPLTRSWITSPPPKTSDPSELALSYPNHGFDRASATSSAPSPSLLGVWTVGLRRSRRHKRAPLIASGIYASGSEGIFASLRSFSNTPHGLRRCIVCVCWDMGGFRCREDLYFGSYRSP